MAKSLLKRLLLIIAIVMQLFLCSKVYATDLVNYDDQYMELKVTSVNDVDGADKQVILEWWSYNLKFKGADLRFSYDSTKVKPSNINTNAYTSTSAEQLDLSTFEFAGDFASYMDYLVVSAQDGVYRSVMSLYNYDDSGAYIENDSTLGYVVNTNVDGGVLLGRMSFRLFNGDIDETTFSLLPDEDSPTTGIKIAQTYTDSYTDQSVFRFTTYSNDANLTEIKYDFFNYEDNENLTMPTLDYKDIDLESPDTGSTDTLSKYTLELNDYLDNISLNIEKSNENSIVKIDGEQIDVSNSKELILNSLGEKDTIIDIFVTAQDGNTTHIYEIIVHRPYGTIKGQVFTSPTQTTTEKYTSNIKLYKTDDVSAVIDLMSIAQGSMDDLHEQLMAIDFREYKTQDDGTYEIPVIPGTYDVLLDKDAYLDHIFAGKQVDVDDVIDLGTTELFAGDINKDGVVQLQDMGEMLAVYGIDELSPEFEENKVLDFNEDLQIQLQDYSEILGNYGKSRIIE